jgi:hypothetical protein
MAALENKIKVLPQKAENKWVDHIVFHIGLVGVQASKREGIWGNVRIYAKYVDVRHQRRKVKVLAREAENK